MREERMVPKATHDASSAEHSDSRILVFIPAFQAEATIESVLGRIPLSTLPDKTRVLVIDDGSADGTQQRALQFVRAHPGCDLVVLKTEETQGIGWCQKLGYEYAIVHGFGAVVLLNGCDTEAPEQVAQLVVPILQEGKDVVLASLLPGQDRALPDRQPPQAGRRRGLRSALLRKFLGVQLAEFRHEARAYSAKFLRRVPFRSNADDSRFDTEMLIQMAEGRFPFAEIQFRILNPNSVSGPHHFPSAWQAIATALRYRAHKLSLVYDKRFDLFEEINTHYTLKLGYPSSHTLAEQEVPPSTRVLDIGSADGSFAKLLRKKKCVVTGVDLVKPADTSPFERFFIWPEESAPFDVDVSAHDVIVMLDVIEHLSNPERFVEELRSRAKLARPKFIVTTGNIAFLIVRLQLLLGKFNYGKAGILDITHRRLFTFGALRRLLEDAGFDVERIAGIPAPFPKAMGTNWFSLLLVAVNGLAIRISKGMFSYQMLMVARPRPTVQNALAQAIAGAQQEKIPVTTRDSQASPAK
jgi:glycosyltransferase involved in cell wall biosynthesis